MMTDSIASPDITCDGKLSKSEVGAAYYKIFGQTLEFEALDLWFSRIDTNQTGFVEYEEFVVATMNEKVLFQQDKLKQAVSSNIDDPFRVLVLPKSKANSIAKLLLSSSKYSTSTIQVS